MTPSPFTIGGQYVDLSPRIVTSTTIAASPSGATETTIANLTLPSGIAVASGVVLFASFGFTVGTNGVSGLAKIKRSTTVLGSTGAVTMIAANLEQLALFGFDTASGDAQAYVLTLTVASGSAASTVGVGTLLFGAIIV